MKGQEGRKDAWFTLTTVVGVLALALAPSIHAVILEGTGDPSYNTNAPTGSLTNSGWQYEGLWSENFLGTPIAPTFFLTAKHIGGYYGSNIVLNGLSYTTTGNYDDPSTDLRIWQVAQTFPYYAPLYTKSNELGSACVLIGRGTDRGSVITVAGRTNGWQWGTTNNIERWGQSAVSSIYTDTVDYPAAQLLYQLFQPGAGSNECDLSYNDSGGALFIQDGGSTGTWKLAGINYTVDGPFSYDSSGSHQFIAALMDLRGFYFYNGAAWQLVPTNYPTAVPTGFYCTRVSARIPWINSIINYNLGNDLGIKSVQIVGSDVQIGVITGSNRLYEVDYTTNLVNAVWTALTNNVPGSGGVVVVTDPGAAANQPARYYRASVLP
ncbi:MAG TPA: hypothetical protein VMP11_17515 [Verrucomicrobiae bacterium]|nr:hypothetical protein [Verrucomicrobiae bacterium]